MKLEDARVGASVRVQLDYAKPYRRGSIGIIEKRYGVPNYTAFDVLFPDGQTEMFWEHQLEVKESFPLTKRWWVFW